jgi:hypothetical protein
MEDTKRIALLEETFLRYFLQLRKMREPSAVNSTAKLSRREAKKFKKLTRQLAALGPSEEVGKELEARGLITLERSCATCTNCWIPTQKAELQADRFVK